jgi:hypothetical protein
MSTLTIRLPATKHQRLKDFALARGVSLIKLGRGVGHRSARTA